MNADIDANAKIIWNYLRLNQPVQKCEAIVALGSADTRVAERAAQLYHDGFGAYIVFSGAWGKNTTGKFHKTEAETFADIALKMGVPEESILIENKSTNTGQNITFTYNLLREKGLNPKSLLLVHKPYMERRTYATFKKQWPGASTRIYITSPLCEFENYFTNESPKQRIINGLVGDLQRIKEYSALGFQIKQSIPKPVWDAWKALVAEGYTNHPTKQENTTD